MTQTPPPLLVGIAGGSGSGKSWLARRLQRHLSPNASSFSLDEFYCDRSHLSPAQRARVNYDHPRAIDWAVVEQVLTDCSAGRSTRMPQYDFSTHSRKKDDIEFHPQGIVLVEGLWLFQRPSVRRLFDVRIFIDCPSRIRLTRRITRDLTDRGRTEASIRTQFRLMVTPMHDRFVQPQIARANLVLRSPVHPTRIGQLARHLGTLSAGK